MHTWHFRAGIRAGNLLFSTKARPSALVYDGFHKMVLAEPELEELAKKRRSDIYIEESNTFVKPIAFNAKKSDGFNPQLVVCDEMAAWERGRWT